MANNLGDMIVRIVGDSTSLDKTLNKSEKELKGLGDTGTKTSKTLAKAGALIQTAFVAAIVVGVAKIGKELISVASDAEETRNKFNVTFRDIRDDADAAAESLADGFGLSQTAAEGLLSATGDLLSGFGFTQEAALDLSVQTNELAADLASFANVPVKQASDAITKGLLGEREAMKSLGISILEADIKQLAEDKGIVGELDRQQKALLTLELATKQSANAIGDFERSQDSFANQSKIAKAAVEDLKVEIGKNLLPVATKSVSLFGDLASKLAEFVAERNKLYEAELASDAGNATLEQQLLLLEKRQETLQEEIIVRDRMGQVNEQATRLANERRTAQLAATNEEIAGIRQAIRWGAVNVKVKEEQAEAEKEIAEAVVETAEVATEKTEVMVDTGQALIGEALVPMTEAARLMWRTYGEGATSAKTATQELKEEIIDWQGTLESGLTSGLQGFEDLGEALVNGEDGFAAFGKAALFSLAAVIRSIGDQLAALSVVALVEALLGNVAAAPGTGAALAGAGAAYIAAGAIEAKANSFAEGGIVMPSPGGTIAQVAEAGQPEVIFPLSHLKRLNPHA